jgi:hypothetical protein
MAIFLYFYLACNDTGQTHDADRQSHPPPPPNHRHEPLLVGWERVPKTARQRQRRHQAKQNDNATGRQNDGGTRGKQRGGARQTKNKAQETSNDVFWAVGMFFFSLISLIYY